MSTFLVPVDFSLASKKALQYALELMDKEMDKMIILHIYQFPIPDSSMPVDLVQNLIDSGTAAAEEQMTNLVEETREEHGHLTEIVGKVVLGTPVQGILNELNQQAFDLVIMGMQGNNPIVKKIMGTTSTRVIKRTNVPVIVVPENAAFNRLSKIAYATNFDKEDILAMDKVFKLANTLETEIRCVHIQKQDQPVDVYKKKLLEEAYKNDLAFNPIHIDVISSKNLISGLNAYIDTHQIDLLVMLTHKKGIFHRIFEGSDTKNMTFQSKIPVLAFQAEQEMISS